MIRRRRWIQPEFFTSEDVLALPRDARLTFIGLWLYADDFGRERTNAALIKADVWPVEDDITVGVVEDHLVAFALLGMIELYTVDGREYFQLTGWDRHQPVQAPSRSNVPPPPSALRGARDQAEPVENPSSLTPTQVRTEGERGEREGERGEWEGETQGEGPPALRLLDPADRPTSRPPSPFCPAHPSGTPKPCKACGTARLAHKQWQLERDYDQEVSA